MAMTGAAAGAGEAVLAAAGRPEDGRFASGCPEVTCTKSKEVFPELSLCLAAPARLLVSAAELNITIFLGRAGRDATYCSAKLIAEPMLFPLSTGYWSSILPIIVSTSPILVTLLATSSLGDAEKAIR